MKVIQLTGALVEQGVVYKAAFFYAITGQDSSINVSNSVKNEWI
ncbi:hypothetical protein [Peribacillus butanolivorans]